MQALTEDQILQRWDTLPDNLRDLLVSETTSNTVQKICEDQKLSEGDVSTVLAVAGDVLMGFGHPDDVASELVSEAKLDSKVAAAIQADLNKKIFQPLKQALDVIYKPADATQIKTSVVPNVVTIPTATDPNAPKMFDVSAPKTATPVVPVPPKRDLSGKGWSGMPPVAPPTTADKIGAPGPASLASIAKPTPTPTPISSTSSTPAPLPAAPKPPSAIAPQPPKAAAEPAPIIVGGTNFSAPQKNSDFYLSRSGGNAQVDLGQMRPQAKPMPAVIEFSKPAAPKAPSTTPPLPTPPAAPKGAVHYTEFTPPPLKTTPAANSGPRNVTEITSVSVPPAPAKTPTTPVPIPKPPQPPQPPQPPRL